MENLVPLHQFMQVGNIIMMALLGVTLLVGTSGGLNLFRPMEATQKVTGYLFVLVGRQLKEAVQ